MDRQYQIRKALGDAAEGLTTAELVAATGMPVGKLRVEIAALKTNGLVHSRLERSRTLGRPPHRYVLTDHPRVCISQRRPSAP